MRGWINYFKIGSMKQKLKSIDEHLRTMLRVIIWKENVKISGGAWVPVEGITKVYRHGLPSDKEEDASTNR